MRTFLENIKTLIGELIGLVGGFIWAKHSNWDYEPIMLMTISAVGIIIFIALRFIPTHEDRPIVELEFVSKSTFRSPPDIIANMSPKDETGQYFEIREGGTYLFRVKKSYNLVIRNNSKNNAYSLTIYKLRESYPLIFEKKYNSLDPLTIDKPSTIPFSYQVYRPMTHQNAEILITSEIPDDLKHLTLIVEYKSESRRTYYTKFSPLNNNEHLKKFSELQYYEKL